MSYQVLARKWRPKTFNDVVGQEHITRTLINSIKNQKIAHAYLLTGTRGIGKTTIARIFAKAIRCENLSSDGNPCLTCSSCLSVDSGNSLDYTEVDGASNNSVDGVRELIETVQYLPTSGKYKVYVIDEVHMLTVSAFNALLKTLEEPPEHVIFIFATTDPQKLLGTVLSRCQRFDFKNSTVANTCKLLKEIAHKEGITFESEYIPEELARQGEGSFRDSLSLLDQVLSLSETSTINEETLFMSLGMASTTSVKNLVEAIFLKDKNAVLDIYSDIQRENIDLKNFIKQVLSKIYSIIESADMDGNVSDTTFSDDILNAVSLVEVVWIYENLVRDFEWALNSFDPEKICNIIFIKITLREQIIQQASPALSVKKNLISKSVEKVITQNPQEPAKAEDIVNSKAYSWANFLKFLYNKNKSIAVNLERGNLTNTFSTSGEEINLEVSFTNKCKIFYDFLNESNLKGEIKILFNDYIGEVKPVNFQMNLINEEVEESTNFQSLVEMEEEELQKVQEEKRQKILNNKYIKNAEELFNTKIEKIVLNDE